MIRRIKTNGKKKRIDVWLSAENRKLIAVGFDPKHDNTDYFFRSMYVNGLEKFTFSLPLSPTYLDLMIFDIEQGHQAKSNLFRLQKITINELALKPMMLDELTAEFVKFASDFAQQAGHLNSGIYKSKKRRFEIRYLDSIRAVKTPSRIHETKNYIEVSKEYFLDLTIPARLNILFHEFSHNFLNIDPDSELEADDNGIALYLGLGHSSIESVHSLTKIFKDIDAHVDRLINLDRNLKQFNHARDTGQF